MPGFSRLLTGVLLGTVVVVSPTPAQQQFATGVDLVPVDVRVVDQRGNPVHGLTARDFQVFEDGVAREIKVFSEVRDVATGARTSAGPPSDVAGAPEPTRDKRVFVIYLGRGRLQHPAMGVDAALDFVRRGLKPGDALALMAWNRATQFTGDREALVRVLERFRDGHPSIEQALRLYFSGVRAVWDPSAPIPATIQARIDGVFATDMAAPGPSAPASGPPSLRGRDEAARSVRDALLTRSLDAGGEHGRLSSLAEDPELFGFGFDDLDSFAELNTQGLQDLVGLYGAVSYLSMVEGEKHLIYITEYGLYTPRADDDRSLAARAANARVAISIVHSGGVSFAAAPLLAVPTTSAADPPQTTEARVTNLMIDRAPLRAPGAPNISAAADWRQATSNTLAEKTGGYFTSTSYASSFFERINRTSGSYYQIGYEPTRSARGGSARVITVQVNRSNVGLSYRRTYTPPDRSPALTRRAVMSEMRIGAAAVSPTLATDLQVSGTATASAAGAFDLEIHVSPEHLTFTTDATTGTTTLSLEVAVFCTGQRNALVGHVWQTVTTPLAADAFARLKLHGLTIRSRVPVSAIVQGARVVVYDSATDRLGSAAVVMPR